MSSLDVEGLDEDLKARPITNGMNDAIAATTMDRLAKVVMATRQLERVMLQKVVPALEKSISAQEDTKKSLDNLTATIEKLDKKNGVLQQGIFWLTGALFLLGAIQIILAILPHK